MGIPYDELHLAVFDKAAFCKEHNIDRFMDDSGRNVRAVSELGIKTYIAMNDFNEDFEDENIEKVYSLDDFYEKVTMSNKKRLEI